jgi:hypothetical protein
MRLVCSKDEGGDGLVPGLPGLGLGACGARGGARGLAGRSIVGYTIIEY